PLNTQQGEPRTAALPAVCGGVWLGGGGAVLEAGDVGAYVGGVVAEVLADAEAGRPGALLAPLVDGLQGYLEHLGDVGGGEVPVGETAAESGPGVEGCRLCQRDSKRGRAWPPLSEV